MLKIRRLPKFLKSAAITFSIWFLIHIIFTIISGLHDEHKSADVAVILGSKVNEDGSLSKSLTQRLNCGLALYHSKRVKKIIVSGGLGKEGFWEGDKMKEYLVAHQVSSQNIIVDNYGNNTRATVKNTLSLRDSLKFNSILIVSQYFHIPRTKKLFRKQNFKNISSVSPLFFELRDLYSLPREFFAYYLQ